MKTYKVGDRIFYEGDYDRRIYSDIVIDIEDKYYLDDKGKKIPYQLLILCRDGNCSFGIEDYNCLSPNDPKCKELVEKFSKFDKQKDQILESLDNIISPWETCIQEEILNLLNNKYASKM